MLSRSLAVCNLGDLGRRCFHLGFCFNGLNHLLHCDTMVNLDFHTRHRRQERQSVLLKDDNIDFGFTQAVLREEFILCST